MEIKNILNNLIKIFKNYKKVLKNNVHFFLTMKIKNVFNKQYVMAYFIHRYINFTCVNFEFYAHFI